MPLWPQDRDDYLRPIVDRHYADGMDMFDSITHEKGASVLDMLRYVLDGSAAMSHTADPHERFFSALHHYLVSHAAQSTETAGLQESLREATGEDLDWFFHEWVFMAGTPAYRVSAAYDAAAKTETVTVTQTQKGEGVPAVFVMPLELAFHGADGEAKQVQVWDDQASQTFSVPLDFAPQWVDFDPDDYIEKSVDFTQSAAALAAAAQHDPSTMARLWAAGELGKEKGADADEATSALSQVLASDSFYGVRMAAATSLGRLGTLAAKASLLAAMSQPDSRVRVSVVQALGQFHGEADAYRSIQSALHDPSYAVQAAAARSIGNSGMPDAFDLLRVTAAGKPEIHVARALEAGLAATGDPRAVGLLLADAQPGMPVRIRLSALMGLAAMRSAVMQDHQQEFTELVSRTLHDHYFPLQQTAEGLVGTFHLMQFKSELAAEAADAPTQWQRDTAQDALKQLQTAP